VVQNAWKVDSKEVVKRQRTFSRPRVTKEKKESSASIDLNKEYKEDNEFLDYFVIKAATFTKRCKTRQNTVRPKRLKFKHSNASKPKINMDLINDIGKDRLIKI
jgi:hypothetical protein